VEDTAWSEGGTGQRVGLSSVPAVLLITGGGPGPFKGSAGAVAYQDGCSAAAQWAFNGASSHCQKAFRRNRKTGRSRLLLRPHRQTVPRAIGVPIGLFVAMRVAIMDLVQPVTVLHFVSRHDNGSTFARTRRQHTLDAILSMGTAPTAKTNSTVNELPNNAFCSSALAEGYTPSSASLPYLRARG
jgi:hypothetical protein